MTSRRSALKSIGLASVSLPLLADLSVNAEGYVPSEDDPDYWKKIRREFMLADDKIFFNPGTVGAMPRVVVDKMVEHLKYIATHVADWAYKDDHKEEFISGYSNLRGLRSKVAQLVNCSTDEISLTDNVTHGMSYLANGLTLQPGDEVLTTDQEHPGGTGAWQVKEKRFGIVFKTVKVSKPASNPEEVYQQIVGGITPRTRVLMVSHMISGSGAILPVKELCAEARKRGIFTILDGAQTIGQIKVDLRDLNCDAYVGCFHKWIGAPAGTGFMFIKSDRAREIFTTVASGMWDHHDDEGYRFTQRGTGNFPVLKGLEAALDFHNAIGPQRVYDRIRFLGNRLRNQLRELPKVKILSPADESMCAGITVYGVEGWNGPRMQDEFWAKARMRPRSSSGIGVRHCTHIFNSELEVDRAVGIVKGMLS